LCFQPAAQRE